MPYIKYGTALFENHYTGTSPYDSYDMMTGLWEYGAHKLNSQSGGSWRIGASDIVRASASGGNTSAVDFNLFFWDVGVQKWGRVNGGFWGGGSAIGTRVSYDLSTANALASTADPNLLRFRSYYGDQARLADDSQVTNTGKFLYKPGDSQLQSDKGWDPNPVQVLLATCEPIPESLHVYLNGIEQYAPQDWTLMPPDAEHTSWWIRAEIPMEAESGDLLEARYVCKTSA